MEISGVQTLDIKTFYEFGDVLCLQNSPLFISDSLK